MTHIPKKKMKLQNVLILVLIAFILVNLGIMQIIKRVQVGADTVKPTRTQPTFQVGVWQNECIAKNPLEFNASELPFKTTFKATTPGFDPATGKARVDLTLTTTYVPEKDKGDEMVNWGRTTIIKQSVGASPDFQPINKGSDLTHSLYITLAPGARATFYADVTFCWETVPPSTGPSDVVVAVPNEFQQATVTTQNAQITRSTDPAQTQPDIESTRDETATPGTPPPPSGTGESKCTEQCTEHYGINPFTWASSAMQNAICEMQCSVVNGLTTFIAFMIREMMLPALGIH